jgi:DNA repair exonuclease SbcCD nuclease subunit
MVKNTAENHQETGQKHYREGVITAVVTADNHLGDTAFGQQSHKREVRQQRLRQAFQQAVDFAISQGVDLFIQIGDLFDTTTPDERDRSFVAERLAQLKQAGVRTFALGGVHDTPNEAQKQQGDLPLAPQISYERLGALHYFPPVPSNGPELEPVIVDIKGVSVGLCGLGVLAGQEGDPLALMRVHDDIRRAALRVLLLHAPIAGLAAGSSLLDIRAQVSLNSFAQQTVFQYIFAGYHHTYNRFNVDQTEVIVAGATQHIDFNDPEQVPGFVFVGLAPDGLRWCKHIPVDSWSLHHLVIHTNELWPAQEAEEECSPTDLILKRLYPLCSADAMVLLRLEGELTRRQYHELDLNKIRRYSEEYCFALAIDDSSLSLLANVDALSQEAGERLSLRQELITLADEWINEATDEQEKKALQATKEELLVVMDNLKGKR